MANLDTTKRWFEGGEINPYLKKRKKREDFNGSGRHTAWFLPFFNLYVFNLGEAKIKVVFSTTWIPMHEVFNRFFILSFVFTILS